MMQIDITIDENTLKELVRDYLQHQLGNLVIDENHIRIQTKSKQNYKAEWEEADFKATYRRSTT